MNYVKNLSKRRAGLTW